MAGTPLPAPKDFNLRFLISLPWKKAGSLYVPRSTQIIQQQKGSPHPGFAIFSGHMEIFGTNASESEVIKRFEALNRFECICSLSKIGLILEARGYLNKTVQDELIREVADPELDTRIRQLPPDQRVFFFELQLLTALRLAILHSSSRRGGKFNLKKARPFIRTLLMVSDVIAAEEIARNRAADEKGGDRTAGALVLVARNLPFNSSEDFVNLMVRYGDLFLELPRESKFRSSTNYVDLARVFKRATGVELKIYFALGMGLISQYIQHTQTADHWHIRSATFFKDTGVKKGVARKALQDFMLDPTELRSRLIKESELSGGSVYSCVTFRQFPLVEVRRGVAVCVNLRFLKEKITGGIYWRIFDVLSGAERERLSRFMGELYQEYVTRIIRRMVPEASGGLSRRFFCEFEYGPKNRRVRTSDIILVYGRSAIFLEVTASRLQMQRTAVLGQINAFWDDIDKVILASSRQLARVIGDFEAGRLRIPDTTPTMIDKIYPVIITMQPFPQMPLVWALIDEKIREERIPLFGPKMQPLQLLDGEDVELLEALVESGESMVNVIETKSKSTFRGQSLKNFLHYSKKYRRGLYSTYMQGRYEEIFGETRRVLFRHEE